VCLENRRSIVRVSWWAQTTEFPCAYKSIEAVAAQGSKSRLDSLAGILEVISAKVANRPFPCEDLPELIDTERCLPTDGEDITVVVKLFRDLQVRKLYCQ